MYEDLYYMLTAFNFIFFFFALYFSWDEHLKLDRAGVEYDMYIFIAIPLSFIGMILSVILMYNSFLVETPYVVGTTFYTHQNHDLEYLSVVHGFFFLCYFAFIAKNAFDFFEHQARNVTGKAKGKEKLF